MSKNNLPLAALPTVFGVSAMSVFLWRKGTPTKEALELPFTPARLRAWAKRNGRPIVKDPDVVLAKFQKEAAKKAGRPTTATAKTAARARRSSSNPSRAGSMGRWAAKRNSARAAARA